MIMKKTINFKSLKILENLDNETFNSEVYPQVIKTIHKQLSTPLFKVMTSSKERKYVHDLLLIDNNSPISCLILFRTHHQSSKL